MKTPIASSQHEPREMSLLARREKEEINFPKPRAVKISLCSEIQGRKKSVLPLSGKKGKKKEGDEDPAHRS